MDRVIRRYAEGKWFHWSCFCGEGKRYLNRHAMVKGSEGHKALHKGIEVDDEFTRISRESKVKGSTFL